MNILTRIGKALGLTRSLSGAAVAWLTGRDYDTGPGVLTSAAQQSSVVYSCISLLAETVSAIPVRVTTSAGRASQSQAETDHLPEWLKHPHPQLTTYQFLELIVWWLCLRGEVFLIPTASHHPASVLVLGPEGFNEIIQNRELAGWRCDLAAPTSPLGPCVLLPEEVIHIRQPNPFNFWRGFSPLSTAWLAAETDYAASQFMKGAMLNNADTGLIISSKEPVPEERRQQILSALNERKRTAGIADRPLFLDGLSVEKPTASGADLAILGNRKFNRQEICAVYKVPQELLGYSEDSNRSVGETVRLNFIENRISPLCGRIEQHLTELAKLLDPRFTGKIHLAVRDHPAMIQARLNRAAIGETLLTIGWTRQEIDRTLDII